MKAAFQVAVSMRPWVHVDALRPRRVPLGLMGQGAYKSSTGPRGGLIFWAYSGNLRTTDGKGKVKPSRLIQLSVLFHPWQRPGMDKPDHCGEGHAASATSMVPGRGPMGEVVGRWVRNREL